MPGLAGKASSTSWCWPATRATRRSSSGRWMRWGWKHARGFTPDRPFFLCGVEHNGTCTYMHVHVIRVGSDEAAAQRGLSQALRDDASLRTEYAALKQSVVKAGASDPTDLLDAQSRVGYPHTRAPRAAADS